MRALIVLCEGIHDIAFLYRVLKTKGFKSYSKKIKDMPSPLNNYFSNTLKNRNYEELNLESIKPPLPTIMKKDDFLILFYPLGGDSKVDSAKEIIKNYLDFIVNDDEPTFGEDIEIDNFSFSFFYDSDNKGIEKRVNEIKNNFRDIFNQIDNLTHNSVIKVDNLKIGCFIFSDSNNFGKLEDILFPLMQKDNEKIFEDSKKFIDNYYDKNRVRKPEHFDKTKSIISICGQLQNSGASNYVTIRHSDYINGEKIEALESSKNIINFFDKFID